MILVLHRTKQKSQTIKCNIIFIDIKCVNIQMGTCLLLTLRSDFAREKKMSDW